MTDELATLMAGIPVQWYNRHNGGVAVVCPEYHWRDRTPEQSNIQLKLKREFEGWLERVKISFKGAPDDIEYKLDEAENDYRVWVELDANWDLTPDKAENERKLRKAAAVFDKVLDVLDAGKGSAIIVVPDTNAVIKEPDPVQYRTLVGSDSFTFLLLPTVLSELDKLKNLHRNPDFREKAEKTITRIKGWRKQGSLSSGVVVDKSIQIRALHNEPNMKNTLSWLDPEILDDRMIASVLEVQSANSADRVILVTGDINLQNKADAAAIEHLEIQ
jgi:rRNA-processing protein FCF1